MVRRPPFPGMSCSNGAWESLVDIVAATLGSPAGCYATMIHEPSDASEPPSAPDYNPLSDYALIGDTHSTALIDRSGSIDWLCWPHHDSPAIFLRLLDARKGGACRIEFDGLTSVSRRYLPQTNILETSFVTRTGRATLIDLMPVNPPETLPEEGPDGDGESRLIRLLECVDGTVSGHFILRPTFDYAREACRPHLAGTGCVIFESDALRLRATATHALRIEGDLARSDWTLPAGERSCLVLTHGPDDTAPAFDGVRDAVIRLDRTRRYWEQWSHTCSYHGPYREQVVRSALCLKLLTYAPTGAIIAAPTTALPEAVPGNRNYDYRFAWLRDSSFTVTAFTALGYVREAAEYLRFLRNAEPERGRGLKLMYGIDGPASEERTLDHLEGWRGTGPVRIGNAAEGQIQIDIYGELLKALHGFLDLVDFDPPQKVHDNLPEVIRNLAEQVIQRRNDPDHGIWELRGEPKQILHSKGMNWVALQCAVAIGRRTGLVSGASIERWEEYAREIAEDYRKHGWNQQRGAYTMFYGSDVLDSALLRLVLYGAFDAKDPRIVASLERIEAELGEDDLLYRYHMEDGLEGDEATFSACAFWRAGVLAMMGRTGEAIALFERLLTRGNDLGLFAEEIDAATGEQRGNFPQGFTHMALINIAVQIQTGIDRVQS